MRIADGIQMLDLPATFENGPSVIHPVVLWDNDHVILVDTGMPGQLQNLRDAWKTIGIAFESLNTIILTHHDLDHIGSLRSIVEASEQKIEVLSHEAEKPYIQAEIPPVRMTQLEVRLINSSDEQRQRLLLPYNNLKANYAKFRTAVTRTLADGEELPFCGGIEVVFTPGHTKGHLSIYLKKNKLLIAGDILNVENQLLVLAPKFTNIDNALVAQSLTKLTHYDIETVICYHGGLFNNDVNNRIAKLAFNKKAIESRDK